LIGRDFWKPIVSFLQKKTHSEIGAVSAETLDHLIIVDSAEEAMKYIKASRSKKKTCAIDPNSFECKDSNVNWRIFRIMAELVEGFEFLTKVKDDVTILGSRSVQKDSKYYDAAQELGYQLAKKKFTVVSGGAGGIMEAASSGAQKGGGKSIGITHKFDDKEMLNSYVSRSIGFNFPFVRKVILTAPSKLFVVFPGGLGTLHELFEILTLEQTDKMGPVPIVLFGSDYWGPLVDTIRTKLARQYKTIAPADVDRFHVVDSVADVMKLAKKR